MRFSQSDFNFFSQVFTIVDSDEDEYVGGTEGAAFLRRANLDDPVLREVWRLACGGSSKPKLGKDEFFVACKLVAVAQSGVQKLGRDALFAGEYTNLALPDFGFFFSQPDYQADTCPPFPKSSCQVRVSNPRVVGSGMSKHALYTVSTRTTLTHFQRSQAVVTRRYSDFRWLHRRLRQMFPGTVLPPIPAKRMFGNLSSRFLETRRLELEHYLSCVCRHPKLSKSYIVQAMIDCSVQGFQVFQNLVDSQVEETAPGPWVSRMLKQVENSTSLGSPSSLGIASANTSEELGIDTSQFREFKQELTEYGRRLHSTSVVVSKTLATRRARGVELETISTLFRSMSLEDPSNGGEFFQETADTFAQVSKQIIKLNDCASAEVLVPLRFQLGKVKSMTKILVNHDSCISALRSGQKDLEKAKKKYALARSSGTGADIVKAEDRIKQSEGVIAYRERTLKEINRSVNKEIAKFEKDKITDLRGMLESWIHNEIQGSCLLRHLYQPLANINE